MTIKRFQNAEHIKLEDYIPSNNFRTIKFTQLHIQPGISEIPVDIDIKDAFAQDFKEYIFESRKIFGFVRPGEILKNINTDTQNGKNIRLISLNDWDDKFLMTFDTYETPYEYAFFVDSDDVKTLLKAHMPLGK